MASDDRHSNMSESVREEQPNVVPVENLTEEKIKRKSETGSLSDGDPTADRRVSMVTASSGYDSQKEERSQPDTENLRESRGTNTPQTNTTEDPIVNQNDTTVDSDKAKTSDVIVVMKDIYDADGTMRRELRAESRNTNTANTESRNLTQTVNEGQSNEIRTEMACKTQEIISNSEQTNGKLQNSAAVKDETLSAQTVSPEKTEPKEITSNDKRTSEVNAKKPSSADRKVRFEDDSQESLSPSAITTGSTLSPGAMKLKQELERMQQRDDRRNQQQRASKKKEVARLKAKLTKARQEQSVGFDMNTDLYKRFISNHLEKEEVLALKAQQDKRDEETRQMARDIDAKHAITERKKQGNVRDILQDMDSKRRKAPTSAAEVIRRELTQDEIQDLHIAFDMFDNNRKGLITVSDLRRLGSMLRFPMENIILKGMIAKLDRSKKGGVNFEEFLEFVVKGQEDGPDPYEEILKGFDLIDSDHKGYVTFEDVRKAADATDAVFSNTMIREMMDEADSTGDGKITPREFVRIMLETNRFRAVKKSLHL